jgi:mono/diheme cytochrome c family protein
MLTNRTPEAHAWAVKEFRTFRSDGQFLPFALDQQTIIFPGFDGGGEWGGPAVDPTKGILYVNATEMAWTGGLTVPAHGGTVGSQLYQSQCAMCHGVNRAGAPPAFPSLVDVDKRLTAEKITDVVEQGKGRMPSFPNIDQSKLAALLDYLRTGASKAASSDAPKELASVPAMGEKRGPETNLAGAAAYSNRCESCHGENMEGVPPSRPMLIGLGSRMTAEQTIGIIHKGRGRMKAIPDLQGGELTSLLTYLGVEINPKPPTVMPEGRHEGYTFTGYRKFLDPDGYPAIAPPWGTLNAIDLKSGKYLWKIPLGEYPDLVRKGMANTGSESYGGPIVTAGGLVFIGATVYDRKFRAFDSGTGKLLWETELPFAGVATPSTYMIEGRQYVVIAASGGRDPKGPVGGAYVAFALGR